MSNTRVVSTRVFKTHYSSNGKPYNCDILFCTKEEAQELLEDNNNSSYKYTLEPVYFPHEMQCSFIYHFMNANCLNSYSEFMKFMPLYAPELPLSLFTIEAIVEELNRMYKLRCLITGRIYPNVKRTILYHKGI